MQQAQASSVVSPFYGSGDYFDKHADYDIDGPHKAKDLLKLLLPITGKHGIKIRSYADVGCGAGSAAEAVADGLRHAGHPLEEVHGYEVSPHITELHREGIQFHHRDFCEEDVHLDLVTMFDVFEHVPDPIGFLRNVADRCDLIGLHIPLDDSLGNALLNRYRSLLADPGHVIYLDTASALNTVAFSGILTLDHRYTYPHRWPTGRGTLAQRLALPLRALLTFIHPWIACKLVGGVSLMLVGITPSGLRKNIVH